MWTISVNQPNLPKGEKVFIHGLGLLTNGDDPKELSEEDVRYFQELNVQTVNTYDDDGVLVGVERKVPDLDDINFPYGVTVNKVEEKATKKAAEDKKTTDDAAKPSAEEAKSDGAEDVKKAAPAKAAPTKNTSTAKTEGSES